MADEPSPLTDDELALSAKDLYHRLADLGMRECRTVRVLLARWRQAEARAATAEAELARLQRCDPNFCPACGGTGQDAAAPDFAARCRVCGGSGRLASPADYGPDGSGGVG